MIPDFPDVHAPLGRRTLLRSSLAAAALVSFGGATTAAAASRKGALVYRGPASYPESSWAVAEAIAHRGVLPVGYVGPGEATPLTAAALRGAMLYVQPGGGEVADAWPLMAPHAGTISSWVRDGGHYVGICLGAYLAADDPGFALWPGRVFDYKALSGASVRSTTGQVTNVVWRGTTRSMYVQDPPTFTVDPGAARLVTLGHYASGHPAGVSARVGKGRVTLVGPHPEAPPWWYPPGLRPGTRDPEAWRVTEHIALSW